MSKIRMGQTPEGKVIQLNLPVLAETHLFINATSGGGKSSLMRVIAERAAKHTQIVVLDWEGEYSTLREKIDLLIVGNLEGADLAVEPRTAKLLARRLLETNVSAVIDLSELEGDAKNLYAAQFLMAMIDSPRALWHPVLVFVDEVQELAPQAGGYKADSPMAQSLQALKAMAARGRKRGFGLIAATQRITKVHKDVISTLKNQMTGQTVLDVDRDRAADNLGFNKQGSMSLRDLNPGDWYGFGPALSLKGVNLFHADQGETTHLGAGQRHTLVIPAPTDAIRKSLSQFEDLPAEVQREADALVAAQRESAELRRKLAERERELKARPVPVQAQPPVEIREVPVPVLNGELKRLEAVMQQMSETGNQLTAFGQQLVTVGNQVVTVGGQAVQASREVAGALTRWQQHPPRPVLPRRIPAPAALPRAQPGPVEMTEGGSLTMPQQRILDTLALFESLGIPEPHKSNVAVFADQSPRSSGYTNNLGSLRTHGLIDYPTAGRVALTAAGRAQANPPTAIKSLADLHQAWFAKLSRPQAAILQVLVGEYPQALDKTEVAQRAGQSVTSSGFTNNLGALRSLGLLDYPRPGLVVAMALLFPEGLN